MAGHNHVRLTAHENNEEPLLGPDSGLKSLVWRSSMMFYMKKEE